MSINLYCCSFNLCFTFTLYNCNINTQDWHYFSIEWLARRKKFIVSGPFHLGLPPRRD